MVLNIAISPAKADRLYWLGRYVERVILTMHSLRKGAASTSEADIVASLSYFCSRVGISCPTSTAKEMLKTIIYSTDNCASVASTLDYAKNNAMLLRNDITSETLAYIEMAVNFLKEASVEEKGLFELQSVSDYLMAFWGASGDNVRSRSARNILMIGRCVEKLDFMIRFDYETSRILDVLERLESIDESELSLCSIDDIAKIKSSIEKKANSNDTLQLVNGLFAA